MNEEEQMLMEILNCRRVDLYLERKGLNQKQQKRFEEMQMRRVAGEPLQYILGHADFMGLQLFVDERVLIPRPETEVVVEAALDLLGKMYSGQSLRVLELGTGSGNIAIAIAKSFSHCTVTSVDIDRNALDLARRNAHFHQVFERIIFVLEDMARFLQKDRSNEEKYDLLISNPPYIPTDKLETLPRDVKHEPERALDGGRDGLDLIRKIMACSPGALRENGKLIFEIWDGQSPALYHLYEYLGHFRHIELGKDLSGTNRFAICRLKPQDAGIEQFGKITGQV